MYLKLLKDIDRYHLEQREKDNREKRIRNERQAVKARTEQAEKSFEKIVGNDNALADAIKEIRLNNELKRLSKLDLERERSKRDDIFFKD
jgi:hypothetical protein